MSSDHYWRDRMERRQAELERQREQERVAALELADNSLHAILEDNSAGGTLGGFLSDQERSDLETARQVIRALRVVW
jgi:hypothetical protein